MRQDPPPRDTRSDALKAAAILGVVGIHVGFPHNDTFRFCVPAFVAVWAFHYEAGLARRDPGHFRAYAASRFVRLLIPYVAWSVVYVLLFHPRSEWTTTPVHTIVGGWFGGYGWSGQYFFVILFQLTWLMPLLRRCVTPRSLWAALIAGAALNAVADYVLFRDRVVSGVGDRLFVYWLPYVVLGVACARGYPRPFPWLLPAALLALMAAPAEFAALSARNDRASVYLLPSVTLGSTLLLLALGPRLPFTAPGPSRFPAARPLVRAFLDVGRQSFIIFVAHLLVLDGLRRLGFAPEPALGNLMGKAAWVGLAVAGSLGLGWALRRSGLGVLAGH